jgi:curved DNA-binding protein CbpA
MMTGLNYYQLLGVPSTATSAQIKKAYIEMALKLHPDVSGGLETNELMTALTDARDTLLDANKRRMYDEDLLTPPIHHDTAAPPYSGGAESAAPPRHQQTKTASPPRAPVRVPKSPLAEWITKCCSWEMAASSVFFDVLTYEQYSHNIPGISGLFPLLMWASWISFWIVPRSRVHKIMTLVRKAMAGKANGLVPKK